MTENTDEKYEKRQNSLWSTKVLRNINLFALGISNKSYPEH